MRITEGEGCLMDQSTECPIAIGFERLGLRAGQLRFEGCGTRAVGIGVIFSDKPLKFSPRRFGIERIALGRGEKD